MICSKKATYENKNGKINLSVLTDSNELLELNNIDESQFKCNAKLRSKYFKILFIENNNEVSYSSLGLVKISITCDENKNFNVSFSGTLINKEKRIYISSTLKVKQSTKQYLKTN